MSDEAKRPAPARRHSRLPGAMLCTALGPLLVVQLALLWLIRDGAEVAVPDFIGDRIRTKLAANGLHVSWAHATVALTGRIALTDARLGGAAGDDVFTAHRLVAILDPYDLLLSGKVTPLRLWLDEGRLLCPAYASPSGKAEVALDNIRTSAHREGDRLIVGTLRAECAGVPIAAHGRLLPSIAQLEARMGTSPKTPRTGNPLRPVAIAAAKIVALKKELAPLEGASLELSGEDVPGGVRLSLDGAVEHARYPGLEADDVRLHLGATWDADGPHPFGRAVFVVGAARYSGKKPALDVVTHRVSLRADFGYDWTPPTEANLTGHGIAVNGAPIDQIDVFCDWHAKPSLSFRADALWHGQKITASGTADADKGSATVDFGIVALLDELRKHPAFPREVPAELASLRVDAPAELNGTVTLGPGAVFEKVAFATSLGFARLGAIDVRHLSAKAVVTRDDVTVTDIDATIAGHRLQGAFRSGFKPDSPYRVLLRGETFPEMVTPFVGAWWTRIWKDLKADPTYPVSADVDVAGQWEGLPHEFVYVGARARRLSYQGRTFDRASVRVIELPDRISVGDIHAFNDDGTGATGRLEWLYRESDHKLDSVRFAFRGRLPLGTAAALGGKDVVASLADITLEQPAQALVIGRYDGPAGEKPDREALEIHVDSRGPFTAWKIPGENFKGVVRIDSPLVEVKDASFRYAGGEAKADIRVRRDPPGYRVTFDAAFDRADREQFFAGLALLKGEPVARKAAAPVEEKADEGLSVGIPGLLSINIGTSGKPEKKHPLPERALITGNLSARIRLPDIKTLDGTGRAETLDDDMFRVPLFGAVTRGLEKMGVNAGNYRFDSASADFTIRDGSVWFPELRVRGREATVQATGRYSLADDRLFFRAMLTPKSPGNIPLLSWVKDQVNKTTRIFPVDIRGTLDKPEWSVDPSPGGLFNPKLDKSIGTPPPPPPDDGRW